MGKREVRLVRLVRVVKLPRILAKVSNVLEHFLPPSSVVVLNKIGRVTHHRDGLRRSL